jgi:hypothetical protein
MIQLTDAAVLVNNEVVGIMPNTLVFTEGLGEQNMRAVSIGDGKTEQVYARDLETAIAMVKFEVPTTPENIALARTWKANQNQNVVQIAGRTAEGQMTRTFSGAALLGDYEVQIGTETSIELEFKGNVSI